jgi:hypothetical protein
MSSNPLPSQSASWSVRCYRQLIRIYPKEFTASFGGSVDQAFRDLARDVYRERGRLGMVLLWFRIVPDFLFSAIELFTAKAGDYLKWSFRVRWVAACSAGFAIGLALSNSVAVIGIPHQLRGIPLWLVLGLLQSFVITGKYCSRTRWVLYSVAGAVIGATITRAVMPDPRTLLAVLPVWAITLLDVPAAIHGAIIGMLQWRAFRKGQTNTSRWILACSAGLYAFWVLAVPTFVPATFIVRHAPDVIGMELNLNFFDLANFVNFLIAGAIFGAITVVPLERILRLQLAVSSELPSPSLT